MATFNDVIIQTRDDLRAFEAAMTLEERLPERSVLDVFIRAAEQQPNRTAITMLKTGATKLAADAYTHPQPHACFIQAVKDDLVGEGGIMDLWTREARLFKYGSGTGSDFSNLRGENEPLSGGGRSSGLMSFLRSGGRAAGRRRRAQPARAGLGEALLGEVG